MALKAAVLIRGMTIATAAGLGGVLAASGTAAEDPAFTALRQDMAQRVQEQILLSGTQTGVGELDPRLLEALKTVPRHRFVPEVLRPLAYRMQPLPVGEDQNIATPFLVALMTQLARPAAKDRVFETGTGAGYHAAILSRVVAEVYSVEVVAPLARLAAGTLKLLGYENVRSKPGDGYYGWREHAPYDAIIVKEAIDHVPAPLLRQLKVGGRLVMPLGPARGPQILTVIEKRDEGRLRKTEVFEVFFSPLQGGERT